MGEGGFHHFVKGVLRIVAQHARAPFSLDEFAPRKKGMRHIDGRVGRWQSASEAGGAGVR